MKESQQKCSSKTRDTEVEEEKENEKEEKEEEPPIVTLKSKGKEKILINEESETEEEEDIDAALEKTISRATRIEEANKSLKGIITSITIEQLLATTLSPAATMKTPTKSPVTTPRASNKRKRAQPSTGAAALGAPEEQKIKPTLSKVIEPAKIPQTNPTKS